MKINIRTEEISGIITPALLGNLFQGVTAHGGATGAPTHTLVQQALKLADATS